MNFKNPDVTIKLDFDISACYYQNTKFDNSKHENIINLQLADQFSEHFLGGTFHYQSC